MKQQQISHWAKNGNYQIESHNNTEYISPASESTYLYNPLENENQLLCDALNLGKYLAENKLNHTEHILDFVHKYGLLGIMTDITDTDIDRHSKVIVHDNIFMNEQALIETSELADIFFPFDDIDLLQEQKLMLGLSGREPIYNKMFIVGWRYSEPLEWIEKYFEYLYSFMTAEKKQLGNFNKPRLTYKIDTQREVSLVCEYNSLKAIIDFAFAKAVTNEKKPLRYCKHCGKVFYAKDIRSEFCSPQCRNQFNVYKSRAKH